MLTEAEDMFRADDVFFTSSPTLSCSLEQAFAQYRGSKDSPAPVTKSIVGFYDPGTELDMNDSIEIQRFLNRKVPNHESEIQWSDYQLRKRIAAEARKPPSFWREVVNCFFK